MAKILCYKTAKKKRDRMRAAKEQARAEHEYRQWELSLSQVAQWTDDECERFMDNLFKIMDEGA